jgi:hypothetical protein
MSSFEPLQRRAAHLHNRHTPGTHPSLLKVFIFSPTGEAGIPNALPMPVIKYHETYKSKHPLLARQQVALHSKHLGCHACSKSVDLPRILLHLP